MTIFFTYQINSLHNPRKYFEQMELAAGYRRMADVVKEHLRAKMEQQQQRGGEAVVSAADIENMFRDVRAGIGGGNST